MKIKEKLISLLTISFFLIFPIIVFAQNSTIDINGIFTRIRQYVLWPIFTGIVIIMFVWAGILYLTARGEPAKIQAANKALVWSTVGVAVGILAYSAYKIVEWLIYGTWSY